MQWACAHAHQRKKPQEEKNQEEWSSKTSRVVVNLYCRYKASRAKVAQSMNLDDYLTQLEA